MIPDTSGRLIAVGDIHGCDRPLRLILDTIQPQHDDVFVFLGDFCNRGPNTKAVLDEVMNLAEKCGVYTVMGNHEEMVLGAFQGGKSDHEFWCKFGGDKTLASFGISHAKELPREYLQFFANCADYHESAGFIFVHAGCNPNAELEKQDGEILRWTRLNVLQKPHPSGKVVVCGHTAQKVVFDGGHLICIDTGCGVTPTGRLTALDLKSWKMWQAGGRNKQATVKVLR